jgi:hypothetical protein
MGALARVDVKVFRSGRNAAISTSAKTPMPNAKTSIPMQAGDSLKVSNACEMVQISTRLSWLFRWAWPSASENGATTTMDENKLLAGGVCNGKQIAKTHTATCAHSLCCDIRVISKVDFETFCSEQNTNSESTISAKAPFGPINFPVLLPGGTKQPPLR